MSECNCNDIIIEIPTENIVIEMTPEGKDGTDGNGIADIVLLSEVGLVKTYRINYTDGSHYDYTVTDGAQGEPGEPGTTDYNDLINKPDLGTMASEDTSNYYDKDETDALLADKADVITRTASGSIVSIPDGTAQPVLGLTVNVEPEQDLHGYDSPWPAGGGTNKYPESAISGTINGVTVTQNGGSYTLSGTASAYTQFISSETFSLPAGTYTLKEFNWSSGIYVQLRSEDGQTIYVGTSGGDSSGFTLASQTTLKARIIVNENIATNKTIQIETVEGSTAPSTYAPYSNICPISGHTQAVVTRTGKNLIDFTVHDSETSGYSEGSVFLKAGTYYIYQITESSAHNTHFQYSVDGSTYTPIPTSDDGYAVADYSSSSYSRSKNRFTLHQDCYFKLRIQLNSNTAQYPIDCMLTIDGTDYSLVPTSGSTEAFRYLYEPYSGTSVTIDLDGTRYGGTVDVKTGVMTVDRAMVSSSEAPDYQRNGSTSYYYKPERTVPLSVRDGKNHPIQTNKFRNFTGSSSAKGVAFVNGSGALRFNTIKEYDSSASMISDIGEIQFVYPLATPFTVTLTPQQLSLLFGDNNVWADTGDTSVTYHADTGRYIDSKLADLKAELQALILEH